MLFAEPVLLRPLGESLRLFRLGAQVGQLLLLADGSVTISAATLSAESRPSPTFLLTIAARISDYLILNIDHNIRGIIWR